MKSIGYFRELATGSQNGLRLFSQLPHTETVTDQHIALFTPEMGFERRVVAAANRYGDVLVVSARHHDKLMNAQLKRLVEAGIIQSPHTRDQGFIDNEGNFLTREEAVVVAREAGQINFCRPKNNPERELFSEDLY